MKRTTILIFLLIFVFISYPILAQTWTPPKRLTWNSGDSLYPEIVLDSGSNIHIVWWDMTPGQFELFYKKSTDAGATWSALNRLTWDPRFSIGADLVIDTLDNLHLAWNNLTPADYDIFYKRSTNSGTIWSAPQRLTWTANGAKSPEMAVDSNNHIHLVYHAIVSANDELFYKKSTNSGVNWTPAQRLTWNPGESWRQKIAIDSNDDIHIVWDDKTPGEREIYFKNSTDGGASWSALKRLTWNVGVSWAPSIAVDSNDDVHIVWVDETPGNHEIFYKKSTNGGASWQAAKRLTWNAGDSFSPELVSDSVDTLHVLWQDNSIGNHEIYYKYSTNGGTNWSVTQRVTWNTGNSESPKVAYSSSNTLYLTWTEDLSNREIFFRSRLIKIVI